MNATSSVTVKVAEGRPPDAGRSLARLDPADLTRLGITPGAVVEIEGKRITAARAMPTVRDLRGRQPVQVDSITCSDAGAVIGKKATLRVQEYRVLDTTPNPTVVTCPDTYGPRRASGTPLKP